MRSSCLKKKQRQTRTRAHSQAQDTPARISLRDNLRLRRFPTAGLAHEKLSHARILTSPGRQRPQRNAKHKSNKCKPASSVPCSTANRGTARHIVQSASAWGTGSVIRPLPASANVMACNFSLQTSLRLDTSEMSAALWHARLSSNPSSSISLSSSAATTPIDVTGSSPNKSAPTRNAAARQPSTRTSIRTLAKHLDALDVIIA